MESVTSVVSIACTVVAALSVCARGMLVTLVCSFLALITLHTVECVLPHVPFLTLAVVGADCVDTFGVSLTVVAVVSTNHSALINVCKMVTQGNGLVSLNEGYSVLTFIRTVIGCSGG